MFKNQNFLRTDSKKKKKKKKKKEREKEKTDNAYVQADLSL